MWITNKFAVLAFVFSSVLLFGGSVRIYNDSPYQLSAKILAADGSHQGSLSLAPQQQTLWQDSSGGNSTWSLTPYTVILTCNNGKSFGTITGVSQGATVSTSTAQGPRFCEKNKDEDQQGQSSTGKQPKQQQQGQTPYNPNQEPFNPNQVPFNPNQTPFDSTPNQGTPSQKDSQGESTPDPVGPADPHSAPNDPIWGPP